VVKVLKEGKLSLVELTPKTGRTHQLRVHMQYTGHPIVGDVLYQGKKADRLYLHAHELTVAVPGEGVMTFTAPIPDEFETLLEENNG
jgi:23S rRNA-/tRNA-specific pseudouridylate synthase